MIVTAIAVGVAALAVWQLIRYQEDARRRKGAPYPPGPKPRPILGNARDIPSTLQWKTFGDWRQTYGT